MSANDKHLMLPSGDASGLSAGLIVNSRLGGTFLNVDDESNNTSGA